MSSLLRLGLLLAVLGCFWACPEAVRSAGENKKQAPVARDWKAHPAIIDMETTRDIYALGDIHGDYDRLLTMLTAAGIIKKDPPTPEKVRWAAGRAVLVCMGDTIDKWKQSLPVLALLQALQARGTRTGALSPSLERISAKASIATASRRRY